MIKKFRFYARFIVVCLLLNRIALARTLVDELNNLVDDYAATFKPSDIAEWQWLIQEISSFIHVFCS